MEIIILPTPDEVGRVAAAKIASVVAKKPSAVIGLATGSSPQGIYTDLQRRVQAGEISFAEARGFALDEYVGIPLEHPESYAAVIARDVVAPLGFDASRVRVPDGRAADLEFAAKEYDAAIRAAGGIDVQILGIGANGHIGFNEPTSSFASRTRIKTLAPSTRDANARFFDSPEQVPTHCMTQGLGTILEARELVLVAQGPSKAAAVAAAIEGPLSS
ncbi:glucosamine-6-phosphate deaminase, partial [Curtobacterium flaccumfaciens]|nr:glucosamine-6-phosphate deaminase [Curtobacterium flaccumfaciens]